MTEYRRQIIAYSILAIMIGISLSVAIVLLPARLGLSDNSTITNPSSFSSSFSLSSMESSSTSNQGLSQTTSSSLQSSQTTANSQNPYNQTKIDSALGIELSASIGPSNPVSNNSILSFTIRNIRQNVNNVSGAMNWPLPYLVPAAVPNTTAFYCQQFVSYAVLQGHYTSENASSGNPLAIDDTAIELTFCGYGYHMPGVGYEKFYVFQPNSSEATGYPPYPYSGSGNLTLMVSRALGGYFTYIPPCSWSEGGCPPNVTSTLVNFTASQIYTVVVGDEWGQLLFLYFEIPA